jgi:hypothetical protein
MPKSNTQARRKRQHLARQNSSALTFRVLFSDLRPAHSFCGG